MSRLPSVSTVGATLFTLPFAAVFLLLFWPTFVWMAERFDSANSFYSHGWLVPFASGWLIWRRRERLAKLHKQPSLAGLFLLGGSIGIHLIATTWRLGFVSGIAMLGALWGLVWTLWGFRTLVALRFPMLFLLFMVPVPGILLIHTSFKMKLFAAALATKIVPLFGIPATQAGSTIHLPGLNVVVDDTCSGLRSLISLVALSTLWTAMLPPATPRWHKGLLVAASIPIAVVGNMIRIVGMILLAMMYGHKAVEGFAHFGSGLIVFGFALWALMVLSHWMQKWSPPLNDPRQSLLSS